MDHGAFVSAYQQGAVKVHVDRSRAGHLYQDPLLMPHAIRKRQALQRLIAFTGIVGGAVSFIWLPWWASLGIAGFFCASLREVQRAAAEGVLEAALIRPHVYEAAVATGTMRLEPTASR